MNIYIFINIGKKYIIRGKIWEKRMKKGYDKASCEKKLAFFSEIDEPKIASISAHVYTFSLKTIQYKIIL